MVNWSNVTPDAANEIVLPLRIVIAPSALDGAAPAVTQELPSKLCQLPAVAQLPVVALLLKSPAICAIEMLVVRRTDANVRRNFFMGGGVEGRAIGENFSAISAKKVADKKTVDLTPVWESCGGSRVMVEIPVRLQASCEAWRKRWA
jgi:hypothetical protein